MSDGHWTVHARIRAGVTSQPGISPRTITIAFGHSHCSSSQITKEGTGHMSVSNFETIPRKLGGTTAHLYHGKGYSMTMGYGMPLGIPHIPRRISVDTGYIYVRDPASMAYRTYCRHIAAINPFRSVAVKR